MSVQLNYSDMAKDCLVGYAVKNKKERSNMLNSSHVGVIPSRHEFLSDSHPRLKYSKTDNKTIVHYGQLKLYLTNLQFITKCWDPVKHPRPKLVYVGAAPCSWGILFAQKFPMFEFHLYDPEDFDITLQEYDKNDTTKNVKSDINMGDIYLYKRLFTDEDAKEWKNDPSVFFVSDIRPFTYEKHGNESEKVVHECMMFQQEWIKDMVPAFSQVKFKLPFSSNYVDTAKKGDFIYLYLDGRVYFQQWVGPLSTEARLVSSPPYKSIEYDYKIYEEMMYHHNVVDRDPSETIYKNVFSKRCGPYPKLAIYGLYNDWDSTMTIRIIQEYIEKVKESEEPATEGEVEEFFRELDTVLETANAEQRKVKGFEPKRQKLIDRRV